MVTAVTPYLEALERIEQGLQAQAHLIIEELEPLILDYNREKQLFERGVDSQGIRLEPYSPYTVALKRQKGEVYNRTTLLDTEAFYLGFYVTASNGLYQIWSRDPKTEMLVEKYGQDIFGLTQENNRELNDKFVTPRLIQWVFSQLPKI